MARVFMNGSFGKIFIVGILILCMGCTSRVSVQVERLNRSFLASTYTKTPDPQQICPPSGQRLIVGWDYPLSLYNRQLRLFLTVRFENNQQEQRGIFLNRKRGVTTFDFPKCKQRQGRILTYRVDVFDKDGSLIDTWKHQFWTTLIDIDQQE
jgi:hypothetical protein